MNIKTFLVAGTLLSLGLWGVHTSIGYGLGKPESPGPGFYPVVLSALLAILAFSLLLTTIGKVAEEAPIEVFIPDCTALARFTGVTLAIFGFAVLLSWLGFLLTSALFTATLFWIGSPKRPALVILLTVLIVAFAYALFVSILGVPFPRSVWE